MASSMDVVLKPKLSTPKEHNVDRYGDDAKINTRKSKKSVSWARSVRSYRIIHVNDMSEQELNATWYNTLEYHSFKKECQLTICLARAAHEARTRLPGRGKQVTERGLEHLIHKERGDLRRVRRRCGMEAVLSEQLYQQQQGFSSPESIAASYRQISGPAQCDANDQAFQYQKVVISANRKDQKRLQVPLKTKEEGNGNAPPRKKRGDGVQKFIP